MNYASLSPAAVDTELARIWAERSRVAYDLDRTVRDSKNPRLAINPVSTERNIAELTARLHALDAEAAPYQAEYAARRWARYFLVTSSDGHVHSSMNCSTCYPATVYAWLPELSDAGEAAMVEEFGDMACTVCFPSAPALPAFHRPGRRTAAALAARTAEKATKAAEKAAEKAAKAIVDIDGSPLRVGGELLRTKVAARNALSQAVQDFALYGPSHPYDFAGRVARLVPALEAAGVPTAPVIDRAAKKAAAEGALHDYRAAVAR